MGAKRTNADSSNGWQLEKDIGHLNPHCLTQEETTRIVLSISPEQEYPRSTGCPISRSSSAPPARTPCASLGSWTPAPVRACRCLPEEAPPTTCALVAPICSRAQSRRTRLETYETILGKQPSPGPRPAASAAANTIETTTPFTKTPLVVHHSLRTSVASRPYPLIS